MALFSGFLKKQYGPFIDPTPSMNTLADYMRFIAQDKRPGDSYEVPILLGMGHGVTFDNTNTAFDYASALDANIPPASVRGTTISTRGVIPRDLISAMSNGPNASYMSALDATVMTTMKSAEFYREVTLHYGCGAASAAVANIGVVSTIVSGTNLGAGGPIVCDLTRASWAGGLWNDMVGAQVDIYETGGTTLVESGVTVTAVDRTHNRITLAKSGVTTDVDATDVILPRTAHAKSCIGVQAILENTGSIFGIDAAANPRWKSVSYSAGNAVLTVAKVLAFAADLTENGLAGTGGKLFCNSHTFQDVAGELAGKQQYHANTDTVKRTGASNIEIVTTAGVIELAVDLRMKQGIAMFLAKETGVRVGTTDNTFRSSPQSQEWHFSELPEKSGSQIICHSNQAPFLNNPSVCGIITGLQNTGDGQPSA